MKSIRIIPLLFSIWALYCLSHAQKPWIRQPYAPVPPTSNIAYRLWLIGDAGKPDAEQQEPTFSILQHQLQSFQEPSSIVFLGDNIYPSGMPPANDPERTEAERRISEQLKVVKDYRGKVIFLPGNHDWENAGENGLAQVKEEERFIEEYLKSEEVFLPGNACPGPAEVELNDRTVLLVLDTQWWLHTHTRNAYPNPCPAATDSAFLQAVQHALTKHSGKQVIVCAHHPLLSNGNHGGYYSWKNHVFPLTMLQKNLFIPIPILGTIGVAYRHFHGSHQDIPHPHYRKLQKALMDQFSAYPGLIYAAGHEHNLQYHPQGGQHYIVSGAGTKTTFVRKRRTAAFVQSHKGFARIDFEENGGSVLRFFQPDEAGQEQEIYSVRLTEGN